MSETSRRHVEAFLSRERRDVEALRRDLGSEALGRMDGVTRRGLIAARRAKALAELVGGEAPPARQRVMVTLKSGLTPAERVSPRASGSTKRRLVANRRRLGARNAERLAASIAEDGGARVAQALWLTQSLVVETEDEAALVRLAARADVAAISHTKRRIVLALDVSRPLIGADVVEANGINGADIDVAVLDTGIDAAHPDLVGVIGSQQDFTGEGVGDFHGHGTHCAGVVASQHGAFRGVAPGAVVHDFKLMDMNGSANSADCVTAIQAAVSAGMRVLSNSWGFSHRDGAWTDADGTCVLCAAADAAANLGSVFVVAAGNEGDDSCGSYDTKIRCPGLARTAITVGASSDSDSMASFSSPGPTPDGRDKPDVTAPGVDIVSARSGTGSDMGGGAVVIDPTHVEASGTSMACPHVAGLAALMLQANGALTPADVKNVMMSTAVDLGAPIEEQGAGRIDAVAAVAAV